MVNLIDIIIFLRIIIYFYFILFFKIINIILNFTYNTLFSIFLRKYLRIRRESLTQKLIWFFIIY